MEIIEPNNNGFTIYSKSGCANCNKVKNLLKENHFLFKVIDCDDYLLEDKEHFLLFIKEKTNTNTDWKTFPIIFFDGKFIGGYSETKLYIDKLTVSFEDNLIF